MEKIKIYTLSDSNGVKYIGKTEDIKKRLYRHIFDAKNKPRLNKRDAWIKSLLNKGEEPIIEVIDEVDIDNWVMWEMYWIEQFKSWGFALKNMTLGGEGTYGRVCSVETKMKMSKTKKGKIPKNLELLKKSRIKTILQYDMDNNFICEFESVNYVKKNLKINNIEGVLSGNRKSAGGYKWKYKDETKNLF